MREEDVFFFGKRRGYRLCAFLVYCCCMSAVCCFSCKKYFLLLLLRCGERMHGKSWYLFVSQEGDDSYIFFGPHFAHMKKSIESP